MNKDEVYLKGYVIGRAADTLGYHGLMVQLENLDIVEIDKNIVHKEIGESQKPVVPQFVADWIEYCKEHNFTLFGCLDPANGFESLAGETFEGDVRKCIRWCRKESNILARAWLYGHTVEEEKRYLVKMKGMSEDFTMLKMDKVRNSWYLGNDTEYSYTKTAHTRKELEDAGLEEVFNSPLFEVEEVEG